MLIIHNSTCIPPTLAAIVPTAGPGPLKSHLFASQDPIQIHHPKSARVGCAEWRIHYSLHSRLLASARVNTSPVPCPHLTLIAQVSRVARNVYSRPDTHSVTSILARTQSSGILCSGYFYKASLFSDKRARVIFPAETSSTGTGPVACKAHRDIIGHLDADSHYCLCPGPLLSPNCVLSVRAQHCWVWAGLSG